MIVVRWVFIPDNSEVVLFFAGNYIQIAVAVQVRRFNSVEFSSFGAGDIVDLANIRRGQRGQREPKNTNFFGGGAFATGDDVQPAVVVYIGEAKGLGSADVAFDICFSSLPNQRIALLCPKVKNLAGFGGDRNFNGFCRQVLARIEKHHLFAARADSMFFPLAAFFCPVFRFVEREGG